MNYLFVERTPKKFLLLFSKILLTSVIIFSFINLRYFLNFPDPFSRYSQVALIHGIYIYVILVIFLFVFLFFKFMNKLQLGSKDFIEFLLLIIFATNVGSKTLIGILSVSGTPYAPGGAMGDLGVHMAKSILASESNFGDVQALAIEPITYPVLWHMLVGLGSNLLDLDILNYYKKMYFSGSMIFSLVLLILALLSRQSQFSLIFITLISSLYLFEWKMFSYSLAILSLIIIWEEINYNENGFLMKFKLFLMGMLLIISFMFYFSFLYWTLLPIALLFLIGIFKSNLRAVTDRFFFVLYGMSFMGSLFGIWYIGFKSLFVLPLMLVFYFIYDSICKKRSLFHLHTFIYFLIFSACVIIFIQFIPDDKFLYGDAETPGALLLSSAQLKIITFSLICILVALFSLKLNAKDLSLILNFSLAITYSILCILVGSYFISSRYNTTGSIGLWPRSRTIIFVLIILLIAFFIHVVFENIKFTPNSKYTFLLLGIVVLGHSQIWVDSQYSDLPKNYTSMEKNQVNFNDSGWSHFMCALPNEGVEFIHLMKYDIEFKKLHDKCNKQLIWNWDDLSLRKAG